MVRPDLTSSPRKHAKTRLRLQDCLALKSGGGISASMYSVKGKRKQIGNVERPGIRGGDRLERGSLEWLKSLDVERWMILFSRPGWCCSRWGG